MEKEIDKILSDISSVKNPRILDEDDFNNYTEFVKYRQIINLMTDDYKFIQKSFSNSLDIILTKFGSEVINQGGWIKYLENENEKLEFENKKRIAELENLKVSNNLNKWLLKTKWLPHFFAFISFLFAVYVYFDSKDDSKKLEERIENLESKILIQKNESKK